MDAPRDVPRFLQVRIAPTDAVLPRLTTLAPGAVIDTVVASVVSAANLPAYRGVAVSNGLPEDLVEDGLDLMQQRYGRRPVVLQRSTSACRFAYQVEVDRMQDPGVRVLLAFFAQLGMPWLRIQDGGMVLRALAEGPDARDEVATMQNALRIAHVPATVEAVHLDDAAVSRWRDLLQTLQALGDLVEPVGPPAATPSLKASSLR